jgi:hypothetical protein
VDAIFEPTSQIRRAAQRVADTYGLREDWLNDAVKGFVVPHQQRILLDLTNLKVYIPEPDYLLAMKALAARVDGQDKADVIFLVRHLGIKEASDVLTIVTNYYPYQRIKPATRYFIEELFDDYFTPT